MVDVTGVDIFLSGNYIYAERQKNNSPLRPNLIRLGRPNSLKIISRAFHKITNDLL